MDTNLMLWLVLYGVLIGAVALASKLEKWNSSKSLRFRQVVRLKMLPPLIYAWFVAIITAVLAMESPEWLVGWMVLLGSVFFGSIIMLTGANEGEEDVSLPIVAWVAMPVIFVIGGSLINPIPAAILSVFSR